MGGAENSDWNRWGLGKKQRGVPKSGFFFQFDKQFLFLACVSQFSFMGCALLLAIAPFPSAVSDYFAETFGFLIWPRTSMLDDMMKTR